MSFDLIPCGMLGRVPPSVIADRAARAILDFASPRAVSIDPRGRVVVEAPRDAAECDLVGVYTRSLGVLELSRRIAEDLRFERDLRKAA